LKILPNVPPVVIQTATVVAQEEENICRTNKAEAGLPDCSRQYLPKKYTN
jgi:hypothetical protein